MPDADVRMRGFMGKTDLDVALKTLRSLVEPLEAESVRLEQALDRTLARDIVSSEQVPSFDKSAMDGYALRAAETFGASPTDPVSFTVIGEVLPGAVGDLEVGMAFLLDLQLDFLSSWRQDKVLSFNDIHGH